MEEITENTSLAFSEIEIDFENYYPFTESNFFQVNQDSEILEDKIHNFLNLALRMAWCLKSDYSVTFDSGFINQENCLSKLNWLWSSSMIGWYQGTDTQAKVDFTGISNEKIRISIELWDDYGFNQENNRMRAIIYGLPNDSELSFSLIFPTKRLEIIAKLKPIEVEKLSAFAKQEFNLQK